MVYTFRNLVLFYEWLECKGFPECKYMGDVCDEINYYFYNVLLSGKVVECRVEKK